MSRSQSTGQFKAGQSGTGKHGAGQSGMKPPWKHWFVVVPLAFALLGGATGVIIEAVYLADYASHWWNEIPAFYLLFGLLSAVLTLAVVILLQRVLLRKHHGGSQA